MFAHDMLTSRHDGMTIFITLFYFFVRSYHSMAYNYDPMVSAQAEQIQGNFAGSIPIESYLLQIQNVLKFVTLNKIFELRKSHGALEAHVISVQYDIKFIVNMKCDSFVCNGEGDRT